MKDTNEEKMKNTTEKKLTETITFRTSAEQKLKLTQKSTDAGIPLSSYVEELVTKTDESIESGVNPNPVDPASAGKLYQIIDKLVDKYISLQEQVVILTKQQKTEPSKIAAHRERFALKEIKKETILDKIIEGVPNEKKSEFKEQFEKMFRYRKNKGKGKSESEMVYDCLKYCMKPSTYFDAG